MRAAERPTAPDLRRCWYYQPFEAVPRNSCKCSSLDSPEHYIVNGINETLERASRIKHNLGVNLALETGATINGSGALLAACELGHVDIVKILLGHRPEVEINDSIQAASARGFEEIVELCLGAGADVNLKDTQMGRTPLPWAAGNGHEKLVQLLLEKNGIDVDTKDNAGQTPLSLAAQNGHHIVAQMLLNKGAKINTTDAKFRRTPLIWAAQNGHEQVVQLLIGKGAETNLNDNAGQTALSLALENGHETLLKLLPNHEENIRTQDLTSKMSEMGISGIEMPEGEISREVAYRMIKGDLSLDGKPRMK